MVDGYVRHPGASTMGSQLLDGESFNGWRSYIRGWAYRAVFVWPWNENAQTKRKQQTSGNRAIWLVYQMDTNAHGFWLVKWMLGWKNFMPEKRPRTFQKSIDASLGHHTATQLANRAMTSPYKGFLWWENEEAMFWSFYPLVDKTNNEHLPKPFFKVIQKLL